MVDQLLHHGHLTAAAIKPTHVLVLGCVRAPTVLRNTARRIFGNIWKARLLHNPKILRILPYQVWEPSITTWEIQNKKKYFYRLS